MTRVPPPSGGGWRWERGNFQISTRRAIGPPPKMAAYRSLICSRPTGRFVTGESTKFRAKTPFETRGTHQSAPNLTHDSFVPFSGANLAFFWSVITGFSVVGSANAWCIFDVFVDVHSRLVYCLFLLTFFNRNAKI